MRNNGRKDTCKQGMEAIKVKILLPFLFCLNVMPCLSSSFLFLPSPHFLPFSIFLSISPLSPLLFPFLLPLFFLSLFFSASLLPAREKGQLSVVQDEDWWSTADTKMKGLLSSLLLSLSHHESWKVRLSLTVSATKILTSCQR